MGFRMKTRQDKADLYLYVTLTGWQWCPGVCSHCLARANYVHPFLTLISATLHWLLETAHGGSINTIGRGKCYKPVFFFKLANIYQHTTGYRVQANSQRDLRETRNSEPELYSGGGGTGCLGSAMSPPLTSARRFNFQMGAWDKRSRRRLSTPRVCIPTLEIVMEDFKTAVVN